MLNLVKTARQESTAEGGNNNSNKKNKRKQRKKQKAKQVKQEKAMQVKGMKMDDANDIELYSMISPPTETVYINENIYSIHP